jgi:hypothetical protein
MGRKRRLSSIRVLLMIIAGALVVIALLFLPDICLGLYVFADMAWDHFFR